MWTGEPGMPGLVEVDIRAEETPYGSVGCQSFLDPFGTLSRFTNVPGPELSALGIGQESWFPPVREPHHVIGRSQ